MREFSKTSKVVLVVIGFVLLLPAGFALEFESEGKAWYNRGEGGDVDNKEFIVSFGSGEPQAVNIRIDDTRVIVRLGECNTYGEQYKFCFTGSRFNPDQGQGSIDYETDREYYQVEVEVWFKDMEDPSGIKITRTFSNSEPFVGEEVLVTVTLDNQNIDTGYYGLSYVELLPAELMVKQPSASWENTQLIWKGNLVPQSQKILTYKLTSRVRKNFTLKGQLRSEELGVDAWSNFSVGGEATFSHNVTSDIHAIMGEKPTIEFNIKNLIDNALPLKLRLEIPSSLTFASGQGMQFEKYSATGVAQYLLSTSIEEDEETSLKISFTINEHGHHLLPYSISSSVEDQEDIQSGIISINVPFSPLLLKTVNTPDYFVPGQIVPVKILLANTDATARFNNVKLSITTNADEVKGVQSAEVDSIGPQSEVLVVNANLTLTQDKQYQYTINASYKKGTQMYSTVKTLHFFPNPDQINDAPKQEQGTQLQQSTQTQGEETIISESAQEQNGTGTDSKDIPILEESYDIAGKKVSLTSIFLVALVVLAITLGIGYWAMHKKQNGNEPEYKWK